MSDARSFDFSIIGAGILGLTTAYELKRRFPTAHIGVFEKEARPGMHASGRNSGVLYSGIYYGRDTLKAQVCAKGAARMREFASEHGIPYKRAGKVIIATSESDLPVVERLIRNARDNHIRAELLDEKGIKEIEPYSNLYRAGIYSPDTTVIDSLSVLNKLHDLLSRKRVSISRLTSFHLTANAFQQGGSITVSAICSIVLGPTRTRLLISLGWARNMPSCLSKVSIYKLGKKANRLVKSSIYPVPDISLPFLGVHITRVINDEVYVGPTAIPAFGRENYGVLAGMRLSESAGICWRMSSMYMQNQQNFRRLVATEIRKYFKPNFLKATRLY